jgi:hypothetical protein
LNCEREEKVVERVMRDTAFYRGIENFPTLKDSRQSPLVVEVHLREGNALGSEEHKLLGRRLCCDQRKEVES